MIEKSEVGSLGGINMLRDCASVLGAKSRYAQPAASLVPD